MLRVMKQDDVGAEMDSSSVDFGRAFVDPVGPRGQLPDSMWGPGMQIQNDPSVIMTHNLSIWRSNNGQKTVEKAAEELDILYANLPEEVFDLTFQDLVDRKRTPEQHISGTKEDDEVKIGDTTVVGKHGELNGGAKKNVPSISIPTKIATLFSPRREVSAPPKWKLSPEEVDKLVRKRGKQSSKREGLYSASVTPTGSFRQVSPLVSPRMSPRTSFPDQTLQNDKNPFEAGNVESADLNGKDTKFINSLSSGQSPHLLPTVPPATHSSSCSGCWTTKLNLKTRCQVCGKAYCRRCSKASLERKAGGRRCKSTCVGKPIRDDLVDEAVPTGCLPFFLCTEGKDSKKTTTLRRPVPRTEEIGVQLTQSASLF